MARAPNPDPDLTAVPRHRVLAGLSLAVLVVVVANLLTVPGVLVALAGFAAVAVLPVVLVGLAVRAVTTLVEPTAEGGDQTVGSLANEQTPSRGRTEPAD